MATASKIVRPYAPSDQTAVETLWDDVFPDPAPHNRPATIIADFTADGSGVFLVACEDHRVVGTVIGGYDGHRGWIYALAVSPKHRRRGIGTALVRQVELELVLLGCRKINLQVRHDNAQVIDFYVQLGFAAEARVSMGKFLTTGNE